MLSFIWRQLHGRAGRSVALLAGVMVATTGFVVLTGATTTSRLEVVGSVEKSTRAAYDILIRPTGSRTPLEAERGVVRPNYLSGLFGGITMEQYEQIGSISGVDIAAPIAMLGYSLHSMRVRLDLTGTVDRTLDRQVIRVDPTFLAERGLSTTKATPEFVYVTTRPLVYPVDITDGSAEIKYTDGRHYPRNPCGADIETPREVLPGGRTEPICDVLRFDKTAGSTLSDAESGSLRTYRLLPDGRFEGLPRRVPTTGELTAADRAVDRLTLDLGWNVPFLLAAVDPAAEDRLVGLDRAVVAGRPLRADDAPLDERPGGSLTREFPVLVTSRPYVDGQVQASYFRLRPPRVAGLQPDALASVLATAPGSRVGGAEQRITAGYQEQMTEGMQRTAPCCFGLLESVVQAGPTDYAGQPDAALQPRTFPAVPEVYGATRAASLSRPWLADDVPFRPLSRLALLETDAAPFRGWLPVGMFDPERLTDFSELSEVPLETYEPPAAEGADDRSRQALGNQPLEPSGNPGGYLSAPPLLLTSLASVPKLFEDAQSPQAAAPISAIRVRVADVDGFTEESAERVRLAAERIATETGLDVDVTLGASPAPYTVELAGGSFGRPDLRLTEKWSALGVASVIVQAVDRKSIVLFLLVLVVCALFLGNAVSAAVRARGPELAVLACLGWPARRIGALILGEVGVLGLAAGLLSLGLAFPLGAALGIDVGWQRAILAVPVALLLALAAGVVPALRAARAHPAAALRPPVATARWVRRPRTLPGLAMVNLVRTPGRTLLAATALAVGVAALTLVTAAAWAFRGTIVGSLLGDAVSLSVRGADGVAAVATMLLGAAAVADTLYLNIRDRAAELAALRAIGWTDAALSRLIGYEALFLGALGALAGAGLGLGGAAWLVGDLPAALVVVAATVALAGVLVTFLAALVPAALLRRLPTARLLAEE
jgi:hypothetical protein